MPTADSQIDEDRSSKFEEEYSPFLAIRIPIPRSRDLRVGVLLSNLFSSIDFAFISRLERLARRFDLDSLLLPTTKTVSKEVIDQAGQVPHVRVVELRSPRSHGEFSVEDFQFIRGFDQNTINTMNIVVEDLVRNLGKVAHILLSDVAASEYDRRYKSTSAGTAFVMEREEELLKGVVAPLRERRGLVELGCGTGRHALMLSSSFDRVQAYDFSAEMIKIADRKKSNFGGRTAPHLNAVNVEFSQRDVEMYPLDKDMLPVPVDCVLGLFGMGSFVEDLPRTLQNVHGILEPDGVVAFSLYNKDALTYSNPPPWRQTSLSATLDARRESLQVTLPSGQTFFIFCRPYTYEEAIQAFSLYFRNVEIRSFPTLSGLLPPEYIGKRDPKSRFQNIVFEADRALSAPGVSREGNYFFVTGIKPRLSPSFLFGPRAPAAFDSTWYLNAVRQIGHLIEEARHPATRHAADIAQALGQDIPYYKAVMAFRASTDGSGPRPVMFILPASARLDRAKAMLASGVTGGAWRLASPAEITDMFGSSEFPLPFVGLTDSTDVIVAEDVDLGAPFWTSAGSPHLSIKVDGLKRFKGAPRYDVART